jgi:hypothetical protein
VKRAYTAAALRWHPDRQTDRSPDAVELADWHIREINRAWEVLRSPASRAAYDDELRTASRPPGTTRRSDAAADRERTPSFADRLVDPRADLVGSGISSPGRPGWRWTPVVVIGVVFVLVLVVTAYASHSHHTTTSPGVSVQTEQFTVGSCVAVTAGPAAVTVPCDQPHTGHVAATTDYPRPCPSGTEMVPLVDQQLALCLTP